MTRLTVHYRDHYFTAGDSHLLVHDDPNPSAAMPLDLCKWEPGKKPADIMEMAEAAAQWYDRQEAKDTTVTAADPADLHMKAMHEAGAKVLDQLVYYAAAKWRHETDKKNRHATSEDLFAAAQDFRQQERALTEAIANFCNVHDEWVAKQQ